MGWAEAFDQLGRTVASRAELKSLGATGAGLTAAVRGSFLVRLRRDHYALPNIDQHVACAIRVGGQLGCLSALAAAGVFVFDSRFTHIWVPPLASRTRSPRSRFIPLRGSSRDGAELHWVDLVHPLPNEVTIDIRDALLQSIHCQPAWATVATFDSALHQRLVTPLDVEHIFAAAPAGFRPLAKRLDARAESGPESALRMIVRDAGLRCELQVSIRGVGRVDMVVEDCLVLEADSRVGHAGWVMQVSDRTRDIQLAKLRMMSLRPTSEHIFHSPDDVREAILGLLSVNRRYR